MKPSLSTFIAILTGVLLLAAYFIPFAPLQSIQTLLVGWTVILAAGASLVGIIYLISTHFQKIRTREKGFVYSIVLTAGFGVTFLIGLIFGPNNAIFNRLVTQLQLPVEASLMGILVVSLILGIIRLVQRKIDAVTIVFVLSVLAFLWAATGFIPFNTLPVTRDVLSIFNVVPVGGGRGILLGIALGSLTAGLRILFGSDRPYRS